MTYDLQRSGATKAPLSPLVGDNRVDYVEPASRLQLLDKLQHLIRFSDFLIVVEGAEGSGKSCLLRQLRLPDGAGRLCRLSLQQPTDGAELLRLLTERSGLEAADENQTQRCQEQISDEARLLYETGQQWLVLIDSAEYLDDEALRLLVNFQRARAQTFRPVLAGRNLAKRLAVLGLVDELDGRWHREVLQPFAADEAEEYLHLRYPALEVLDGRRLRQLVRRSKRYPGALERLAGEALRVGTGPRPRRAISRKLVSTTGIGVILVSMLGLAGWLFWAPDHKVVLHERVSLPLQVPVAPASLAQSVETLAIKPATAPVSLSSPPVFSKPPDRLPKPEPEPIRSTTLAGATTATSDAVPPSIAPITPSPESSTAPEVAATEPDAPVVERKSGEISPAGDQRMSVEPRVLAPDTPDAPVQSAPSPEVAQNPVPQAEPRADVATAAASPLTADERALLALPDRGYTLQLLGARQVETARKFISRYGRGDGFHYFSTLYKGKPWHVVVYGRFESRKAAVRGVGELPRRLQKLKPWARSIEGVKADIRKTLP